MTKLSLDLESRSEEYFGRGPKNVGLDRYSRHPSTKILMLAYAFDDEPVELWDCTETVSMPGRLRDALRDPDVEKHAFNAQFERVMFRERWGLDIPYEQWRCTLVLAYMQSFIGGLDEVGECVGLPDHMKKDKRGDALIRQFSSPQRVTKANPFVWRDSLTDPDDWEAFKEYCKRDVVAEREIWRRLSRYEVPDQEWALYHLDQKINDRGLPVDRVFLTNASAMAARRKAEITEELVEVTGLPNPNSPVQLTQWLVERGYPFNDINKDTVSKVLNEDGESATLDFDKNGTPFYREGRLPGEVVKALRLRQQVARTSVKKFDAVLHRLVPGDDVVRYAFQFAGASRTNRWASRGGVQLHNMPRTPGFLEDVAVLKHVTELIRQNDYDGLREFCEWCVKDVDMLDALVGCVRSMLRATAGEEFVVNDLSSIETVGIGLLADSQRILDVFRQGRDAYKDFATVLFKKPYEEVTKAERSQSKPPVLAGGFGIAGGELVDGRRTGLWEYAEKMGIPMTREEAHAAVDAYHEAYPEVRPFSWALKDAMVRAIKTGEPQKIGLLRVDLKKPYMRLRLPSGRFIYYHKPKVDYERRISRRTGNEYTASIVSCMGKSEQGNKWVRRNISPGLAVENCFNADTLILTGEGPKRIVDVKTDDKVWDGGHWVVHKGVVARGRARTIDFGGVRVTPEHRIDVDGRWLPACEIGFDGAVDSYARHHRRPDGAPGSLEAVRLGRQEDTLVDAVRLRRGTPGGDVRVSSRSRQELRVSEARYDLCGGSHSRDVEAPGLRGLAVDERPVQTFDTSRVAQLWRSGDNGLCPMDGIVRDLLGRHGAVVSERVGPRSQGQQPRVQPGELPVGDASEELAEYPCQYGRADAERPDVSVRGGGDKRHQHHHDSVSASERLPGGTDVRPAGCYEPVFDLMDCGPLHRFTVVSPEGKLFLAHNCDQAMCRDILGAGMLAADAAGFDLRGSVHDEIIALRKAGDARYSHERLGECMTRRLPWLPADAPIGSDGFTDVVYRK